MKDGPIIVSIIVAVGFTAAINLVMFLKIDFSAASGQSLLILIGALGTSFTSVVNYWLGATKPPPPSDKS